MLRVRLFQPFPADAARGRAAVDGAVDRRPRPHQGAGRGRRAALPGGRRRARRGDGRRRAAVRDGAAGHRRPLRPVVQGDDAVDDQADLRRARGDAAEARTSRSASTTTSPTSACRSTTSFRHPRPAGEVQAVFFGLGSDGTVGANKASVKIIGESTDLFAQGYFVYDSKKSGSVTVSHLRFGPEPIRSTYLDRRTPTSSPATSSGCSTRSKVLEYAKPGRRSCSTRPYGPDEVWDHLPGEVQRQLIDKEIDFWVIDAVAVADEAGHGQPHQHRHAAVLLPARRRPARRRGDRPDQGLRREDLRQARRGGRRAQLRRHRPLARAPRATSRSAASRASRATTAAGARTTRPTSSRGSPRG